MYPLRWLALPAALWTGSADAWLTRYDFSARAATEVSLPPELREISGLALDARGHLFAHQDETSQIHEIDPAQRRVVRSFHVGRIGLRGDFEGIAVAGDRFFLSNSAGDLFEFRLPADGGVAAVRTASTGLGELCELEGLAYDQATASLLLPCKTPRVRRLRERLTIFAVPLATLRPDPQPRYSIPFAVLEEAGLEEGFNPSALEVHPSSGSLFLLSAQETAIVEIGRDGVVLARRALARSRHAQPEGIAFGPDLALWIADEGDPRGSLRRYPLIETGLARGASWVAR